MLWKGQRILCYAGQSRFPSGNQLYKGSFLDASLRVFLGPLTIRTCLKIKSGVHRRQWRILSTGERERQTMRERLTEVTRWLFSAVPRPPIPIRPLFSISYSVGRRIFRKTLKNWLFCFQEERDPSVAWVDELMVNPD